MRDLSGMGACALSHVTTVVFALWFSLVKTMRAGAGT